MVFVWNQNAETGGWKSSLNYYFLQDRVLMEMACEEARQAGWVVCLQCGETSGESEDQEAEQSGAGGSAHEGNKTRV